MLLYIFFRFSEDMDQMFLTVQGALQGSFRATLCVASVFVHVVLRNQDGELGDVFPYPPTPIHTPRVLFFGVNLDYLDFCG